LVPDNGLIEADVVVEPLVVAVVPEDTEPNKDTVAHTVFPD
jgi:hypothetical protein